MRPEGVGAIRSCAGQLRLPGFRPPSQNETSHRGIQRQLTPPWALTGVCSTSKRPSCHGTFRPDQETRQLIQRHEFVSRLCHASAARCVSFGTGVGVFVQNELSNCWNSHVNSSRSAVQHAFRSHHQTACCSSYSAHVHRFKGAARCFCTSKISVERNPTILTRPLCGVQVHAL